MTRKVFVLIIVLLTGPVFYLEADAQQKVNLPELKEKQKGFFTRINLGVATGKVKFEDYFNITGLTIPISIQLGSQLSPNFALYATYSNLFMASPVVSDISFSADMVSIPQLGVGFAYYFGKGKTYIYADGNYAITTIVASGSSGSTNGGLGLNIGYGYDYNLFKRIDLGANIFYHYSTMKDKPSSIGEPQVTNNFLGACLSFRFGR